LAKPKSVILGVPVSRQKDVGRFKVTMDNGMRMSHVDRPGHEFNQFCRLSGREGLAS